MDDTKKIGEFDLAGALKAQGIEILGPGQTPGTYRINSKDGEGDLDVNGFVKSAGVDPTKFDVIANTPATAVQISPLGIADRGILKGLGNAKGQLNYLKSRFEDVKYSADNGEMTVKQNGLWHAVDPSGLGSGNAWDKTKEILKDGADMLDLGLSAAYAYQGAAAGAAVGSAAGPLGTAVGSVLGAGVGVALEELGKTSLGRLAGTYEATPEEQAWDIGKEAILNMAGQTIPAGMLYKAAKGAGAMTKIVEQAPEESKGVLKQWLTEMMGKTSNAGTEAAETMVDHAPQVESTVNNLTTKYGSKATDMIAGSRQEQIRVFDKLIASEAQPALSREYGKIIEKTAQSVGDDFVFQGKKLGDAVKGLAEQSGLLKIGDDGKFVARTVADLAASASQVPPLAPEAESALVELANRLHGYTKGLPNIEGKAGARAAFKARQSVGQLLSDFASNPDMPPEVTRMVPQIRNVVNEAIGQQFADHSPAAFEAFQSGSKLYGRYKDAVDYVTKMSGDKARIGQEINKFFSKNARAAAGEEETIQSLGELLGKRFEVAQHQLKLHNAAQGFIPVTGDKGAGGALIGGVQAAAFSPRGMLKMTSSAAKVRDFVKQLPAKGKAALLADPQALGTFLGTLNQSIVAPVQEEEMAKQLAAQASGQQQ